MVYNIWRLAIVAEYLTCTLDNSKLNNPSLKVVQILLSKLEVKNKQEIYGYNNQDRKVTFCFRRYPYNTITILIEKWQFRHNFASGDFRFGNNSCNCWILAMNINFQKGFIDTNVAILNLINEYICRFCMHQSIFLWNFCIFHEWNGGLYATWPICMITKHFIGYFSRRFNCFSLNVLNF